MNYRKALEQSIIYIENHLTDHIKVEEVAQYAGYSYYHLNRQFVAILGESVGSYIKKRRLANAAQKLLYTDTKIIDLAIENDFESPEAFSRAFKTMYKTSPQNYRKSRMRTFVSTKECLDASLLEHLLHHVSIQPTIVCIDEIKIIGIRRCSPLQTHKIKENWGEFYSLLDKSVYRDIHSSCYGIYESNNENIHFSLNDEMIVHEILGIQVNDFNDIPEEFITKTITGGRYAVFTHRGSLATLSQTINYIWGTWLLSTNEEMDVRDTFEVYDKRFLGYDHPETEIDIYIAIK